MKNIKETLTLNNIKSDGLNRHFAPWMDFFLKFEFVTCIGHLENVALLSNVELPNVDIFPCRMFYKVKLFIIPTNLMRKSFKYWEAHMGRYSFYKILIFTWQLRFDH